MPGEDPRSSSSPVRPSSELRPWRASRGSGARKTVVKRCSHIQEVAIQPCPEGQKGQE